MVDLTVLGLRLDSLILKVLSKLNDSLILISNFVRARYKDSLLSLYP